ncbi:MAG: hypothetical protein M3462_01950 [Chloroflexota bacterium]|nr:hypothetical protein [Chloroflexota bacterium]
MATIVNASAGVDLPVALAPYATAIERSRHLLSLDNDWDGEGSPGYQETTWRRAVDIVLTSVTAFVERQPGAVLPVPAIAGGQDGGIDILWDAGTRHLMITVPPANDGPVTFHGFDQTNDAREVKGSLDPADANDWIVRWLTE